MLNLNYEPNIIKSTANLTREEWLKDRRLGIGGSEASIVMGVSPWATRRDLYYDKIGRKSIRIDPEEDNWVAKQVGNRLEELVAMIFSRKLRGLSSFSVSIITPYLASIGQFRSDG